ncbi:TAXi_C domain-containing protein [Pseudomonas chlororaphis]
MFRTYEWAEVPLVPLLGETYRTWMCVEYDVGLCWFNVLVEERNGKRRFPLILMVVGERALCALLAQQSRTFVVRSVQFVSSGKINQSGRHRMEPLVKIELLSSHGLEGLLYEVEGSTYFVGDTTLQPFTGTSRQVIFDTSMCLGSR